MVATESKRFVCQYRYADRLWIVHIDAADWEDARARAVALGGLEVLGEYGGSIPAAPGAGALARFIVTLKNIFCGSSQ